MDPKIDVRFYDLLSHLWRGGQFAHWWAKTSTSKQSLWFATSQPADINVGWLRQMDFYYTVNPLGAHADRSVHHKSANEDVAAVNTLIAEFDDKDYAGNATGHAQTLTPPPSVIIHSGGGVHCYWLLDTPYLAPDRPARARIADIEKRWNAHIGGSVGVNDIARVLRIPGSLNFKYSPARPVTVCEWHLDRLYRLADLEALLPPAPVAATAGPAVPNDMADQELLELARRAGNGAKFDRLWRGNLADYGGDHSSADLGLCALLSFWTGRDKARMDTLFRQSGLMRDKWERQQYREDTLDKAIATTGECYTPGMGTDLDAIQAAMAAVGLAQRKAHTNGHSNGTATSPVQPKLVIPAPVHRLADLEPQIVRMLARRLSREDKMELAALVVDHLTQHRQLLWDTATGQAFLQDENWQVWGIDLERQDHQLRRYVRDAGINSTEYMYQFLLEELRMAASSNPTELQRNMLERDGALYIPCGPSFFVRATLDGLEKLPNGTDGVYFVANSVMPEWEPVALEDAINPTTLRAMQVAINTPPDTAAYTPEAQRTLLEAWVVAFMAGIRPLPLLATLGNKGGGKSMLLRSILKLVMGAKNDLTTLTSDKRDYDTMVTNDLLVGLDNVDQLANGTEWFFDSLATTATGGTNKRRQYHTLAQQITLPIVAAVMVSSRTASFARPDVAERTLPIFVRPFEDGEREADSMLLAQLPLARNQVLSWMAYHAVNVLDRRRQAPKGLPARFQDFAQVVWAYCASTGQEDAVTGILTAWRSAQSLSVGDADPLMRAIVEYLNEDGIGMGLHDLSAKELVQKLQAAGADMPYLGGGKVIAQKLRELKGMLNALGITLTERTVMHRPKFSVFQQSKGSNP